MIIIYSFGFQISRGVTGKNSTKHAVFPEKVIAFKKNKITLLGTGAKWNMGANGSRNFFYMEFNFYFTATLKVKIPGNRSFPAQHHQTKRRKRDSFVSKILVVVSENSKYGRLFIADEPCRNSKVGGLLSHYR